VDGINNGQWGYNNVQWHGFTYYHRFNDQWHLDFESYYLTEKGVLNDRNPIALATLAAAGTPFSPQYILRNTTNTAYCENATELTCDVWAASALAYLNYTPDPLNNISLRLEWYNDNNGWQTGTGAETKYFDTAISWQHWFSPQFEVRPEISYWKSFATAAFNGNPSRGIAGNKPDMTEFAADAIIHF
jgi:hypothetical protein